MQKVSLLMFMRQIYRNNSANELQIHIYPSRLIYGIFSLLFVQHLNVLPNTTTSERTGTITIIGADTIIRTIEIIQHYRTDPPLKMPIELSLFPNPAHDKLSFQFTNYTFEGLVEIYDMKGYKLSSRYMDKEMSEIDIKHLVSGMYFLKFYLPKEYIVEKFIKA